jgi:hypothetical protein
MSAIVKQCFVVENFNNGVDRKGRPQSSRRKSLKISGIGQSQGEKSAPAIEKPLTAEVAEREPSEFAKTISEGSRIRPQKR